MEKQTHARTYKHKHTLGRTFSERVICSLQRPLPTQHQQTQKTNVHALNGIGTCDPNNQAAADLRIRHHGISD
jgi:hypothetical protein